MLLVELVGEQLHERVGVGDGGGLRGGDHEDLLGGGVEVGDVFRDAGLGVDEDEVEIVVHPVQGLEQLQLLLRVEPGEALHPGPGRQDADALRPLDQDRLQALLAAEEMVEVVVRRQPEDHVDVRQAQVGVEDEHPLAHAAEQHRQVGDHRGLAHPALAARHRQHPGGAAAVGGPVQGAQGGGLVPLRRGLFSHGGTPFVRPG